MVVANAAGTRRRGAARARRSRRCRTPAAPPPFDLYRPEVTAGAARPSSTTRRSRCATRRCRRVLRDRGGRRGAGSARRWTAWASPRSTRRRSSRRPPSAGANVFAHRLLRAARLPGPVPAVLQAGHGRRVRAGLRGRAGVPGRAARHRPAPGRSTPRLDAELGFITDHHDVMAVLRDVVAGMVAAVAERAPAALDRLGVSCRPSRRDPGDRTSPTRRS